MKKRVLVPISGQRDASRVIPVLQEMIDRDEVREAILVRVQPPTPTTVADFPLDPVDVALSDAARQAESVSLLQEVAGRIGWGSATHDEVAILGDEAASISGIVKERGFDSVLMVSSGQSRLARLFSGGALDRVLESVCVPITVLRDQGCPSAARSCA